MEGFIQLFVGILMVAARLSHGLQVILGASINDVESRNVSIGYLSSDAEPASLKDNSVCRITASGNIVITFQFTSDFMTFATSFDQNSNQGSFSHEIAHVGDKISIAVINSVTRIKAHGLSLRKKSQLAIEMRTKGATDALRISCDSSTDGSSDRPVNTANFCSLEFIVTLGCLAMAFLLILLGVSVALCCIMPRKHRKQVAELRKSVLILESRQGGASNRRIDPMRPDTVIYDDADIKLREDSYYQGSVGNDHALAPVSHSHGLYANASSFN